MKEKRSKKDSFHLFYFLGCQILKAGLLWLCSQEIKRYVILSVIAAAACSCSTEVGVESQDASFATGAIWLVAWTELLPPPCLYIFLFLKSLSLSLALFFLSHSTNCSTKRPATASSNAPSAARPSNTSTIWRNTSGFIAVSCRKNAALLFEYS